MRYLTIGELLELYRRIMVASGGAVGIHDLDAVESALAQPKMTFDGQDLYPEVTDKAAAQSHPFTDGNKRAGHAAMELFLIYNGFEIQASVDDQESIVLRLASGELQREEFVAWLREHVIPVS